MSGIPQPHGGALVNGHSKMDVAGMEEIKVSASIQSEIENIADGIFSPLDGFLGQADFESVISSGKLVNGTTWTIPIVLDLSSADAAKAKNAGSVLLRGPDIAAVLDVAETFAYDKKKMSKGVFGTDDEKHPGVARVIVSYACMIAPYDNVSASIFCALCMVYCLFWSSISHLRVQCGKHTSVLWIIIFNHNLVGFDDYLIGKITRFFLSN